MSLYLNTSLLIPLFIQEARSQTIAQWIASIDRPMAIADLAVCEFHAVLSRLERSGELAAHDAGLHRKRFEEWRGDVAETLENIPADIRVAAKMVCLAVPKLLTADAIHLATCKRLQLTLATHDTGLAEIAVREGVTVLVP